ncbi:hypothetical protein PHJA_000611000 [Phtheirospermum japonicum]|uniref:Cotton fiber protein n=1 Tax=Phtheirospermum japonicum TaxID=374723 RepID=A0A830BRN4_9LAMI|nr:hypothetical protein PHJA_000611000 [Phtheirospermum japonicum]
MPKKNSAHLQKLPTLLKFYIFLAKFKKPIIPNYLIFLKKMKRMKKMKLLKKYSHYHYGYVKEYEFSPSNTPLAQFRRNNFGKMSFKKLYSDFLLFSKCLGGLRGGDKKDEMYCLEGSRDLTAAIDLWEDESVDERAERFIRRFYEDMRKQRQEIQFSDEWI